MPIVRARQKPLKTLKISYCFVKIDIYATDLGACLDFKPFFGVNTNERELMGLLSKVFGAKRAVKKDAQRFYQSLMAQSRKPEFYGEGRVTDNYDGRIDVLTLHMACVLKALNGHGEQGERLAQALFDEMKDDFEVALREEGISDTGVAKRIKPMISHFYARVKIYTEALHGDSNTQLNKAFDSLAGLEENPLDTQFKSNIASYTQSLSDRLAPKTLGQLALCEFDYPDLT